MLFPNKFHIVEAKVAIISYSANFSTPFPMRLLNNGALKRNHFVKPRADAKLA